MKWNWLFLYTSTAWNKWFNATMLRFMRSTFDISWISDTPLNRILRFFCFRLCIIYWIFHKLQSTRTFSTWWTLMAIASILYSQKRNCHIYLSKGEWDLIKHLWFLNEVSCTCLCLQMYIVLIFWLSDPLFNTANDEMDIPTFSCTTNLNCISSCQKQYSTRQKLILSCFTF